ncbi:MAG: hypothetical protein ABSH03_07775 [Candidatus Lustribacter sp.]|jgi:hypothetical protein
MLDFRFRRRVRFLSVAVFAALAVFSFALPVRAEDTRGVQAKRQTTSFQTGTAAPITAPQAHTGYDGFLYFPGAQPGMNLNGRVNVGKSHVYVPYYGNVSNDPTHPGVSGTAGIAYGFRTWDISVLNGAFGTVQPAIPGADTPKVNPSLTFSIRF